MTPYEPQSFGRSKQAGPGFRRFAGASVVLLTSCLLAVGCGSGTDPSASSNPPLPPPPSGQAATGPQHGTLHAVLEGRVGYTQTTLADGTVLIAGGRDATGPQLKSAAIYDPKTQTLATVPGHLADFREDHTATLLKNGSVLIAGGLGGCCHEGPGGLPALTLASAEVFSPATGSFACVGGPGLSERGADNCPRSMVHARERQAATLLPDGTVLLTGGRDRARDVLAPDTGGSVERRSAELYDPARDAFRPVKGAMHVPRSGQTATLLQSGLVRIHGGTAAPAPDELYHPHTQQFTIAPPASSRP